MAIPVDYDQVSTMRTWERRGCKFYDRCLTRSAYLSPGYVVPCASCQGAPADLPGLAVILQRFKDCREPVEIPELGYLTLRFGRIAAISLRPQAWKK